MQEVKIKIINKDKIHSSSANIIAKFANKYFSCNIKITVNGEKEKLAIKILLNLLKYNFSKELEK
ncbi:HPr family phosphocarrier protein [Borreliella japonica]|uniref:HPr family phosphocarrier protein n=1 Tax=Borreliella japonica TaxID=34095 RepID=UPI00264A23EB|nr:HPr family phosphocarrier protein [Borreliella japonica]WKC88115.1 HPr family phosphocarrier protein [Borreliella japonica]